MSASEPPKARPAFPRFDWANQYVFALPSGELCVCLIWVVMPSENGIDDVTASRRMWMLFVREVPLPFRDVRDEDLSSPEAIERFEADIVRQLSSRGPIWRSKPRACLTKVRGLLESQSKSIDKILSLLLMYHLTAYHPQEVFDQAWNEFRFTALQIVRLLGVRTEFHAELRRLFEATRTPTYNDWELNPLFDSLRLLHDEVGKLIASQSDDSALGSRYLPSEASLNAIDRSANGAGADSLQSRMRMEMAPFFELRDQLSAVADVIVAELAKPMAPEFLAQGMMHLLGVRRLMTGLMSTLNVAASGAAVDALTIASSVFEMGFALTYVGVDRRLAERWCQYSLDGDKPWQIKEMLRAGWTKARIPIDVRMVDLQYARLCGAKHGGGESLMRLFTTKNVDGTLRPLGSMESDEQVVLECVMSTVIAFEALELGLRSAARLVGYPLGLSGIDAIKADLMDAMESVVNALSPDSEARQLMADLRSRHETPADAAAEILTRRDEFMREAVEMRATAKRAAAPSATDLAKIRLAEEKRQRKAAVHAKNVAKGERHRESRRAQAAAEPPAPKQSDGPNEASEGD